MKILAFHTALGPASAAIARDGQIVWSHCETLGTRTAEAFIPMLLNGCAATGIRLDEFDLLAVTAGPGGFTGVRIGLATARGLALATGAAVLGFSTLEVLAVEACLAHPGIGDNALIASVLDARRGALFIQVFTVGRDVRNFPQLTPLTDPVLEQVAHAQTRLPVGPVFLCGNGAAILCQSMPSPAGAGRRFEIISGVTLPGARTLALCAAHRGLPAPDAALPRPLYLRNPDAKLPA